MSVTSKADFTDHVESLPPLPGIVHRVAEVTRSPRTSAEDIAKVLREDEAIAAKILHVANSAFFGTGREITEVSRAIVMLGTVAVRNLVLGIAARDALPLSASQEKDRAMLWRHAIATASAAELIARHVGYRPSEEAFVAGLLHDIGQLAMMTSDPDSFDTVFREQGRGVRFLTLERSQFGMDHTQAGFKILNRWKIPKAICQVALRHHDRQLDANAPFAQLLAIVMLADIYAQMMGFGFDMPVGRLERAETASQILGLDDSQQMRVLDTLNGRIDQAVEMFTSLDAAPRQQDPTPSKRAVWFSPEKNGRCVSQLLLEHLGYEVIHMLPDAAGDCPVLTDLVIIALSDENAATELASEIIRQRLDRILLLSEPKDGVSLRRCDPDSGLCHVPRLFTVFDIQWAERQFGVCE